MTEDTQRDKHKLRLILDDIKVSRRQILSLQSQINFLNQKIEDLDFQRDELISNMPEPQEPEQNDEVEFFTVLATLETEEASLKGELETYKKLKRDLEHEKTKYLQIVKKLTSQHDNLKSRLEMENDLIIDITGKMQQLSEDMLDKEAYLDELKQSCDDMMSQQAKITDHIQSSAESALTDMKEQEKERIEELTQLEKRESELKSMLERCKRSYDESVMKMNANSAKSMSVSHWMGDRTVLTGKLKRSRQRLAQVKQSIAAAEKREQIVAEKFRKLLNEDDPTGTGDLAKAMVRAELGDVKASELASDLEIEREYHQELINQLELLDQSFRVFSEHRDDVLSGLNEELQECTQAGYLRLMKEELDNLQVEWNQSH